MVTNRISHPHQRFALSQHVHTTQPARPLGAIITAVIAHFTSPVEPVQSRIMVHYNCQNSRFPLVASVLATLCY